MLRPSERGRVDCCTVIADSLMLEGWPDLAAAWRGRYASLAEAEALMGCKLAEFAPRLMADLGWPEIEPAEARDLDIGLKFEAFAFIHVGGAWLGKSVGGCRIARRVDRAWRPVRRGR